MLKLVFCFAVAASLAGAQQARKDICTKVNTLLIKDSVLKPNDMFGFADATVKEAINNKKLADIPFKDIAMREIPKSKVGPFNKLKNDMDNCLKKKNRKEKTDEVMDKFGGIVLKIMQPPYDRIAKKRDDARKNKKTDEELKPILFVATKDEFTKGIIQKVLDKAMKDFPCPVWQCLVTSSKPVFYLDKIQADHYRHIDELQQMNVFSYKLLTMISATALLYCKKINVR